MQKFIASIFLVTYLTFSTASGMYMYEEIGETIGVVVAIDGNTLFVTGEPITKSGLADIVLDITNTPIYDLLTGFPVGAGFIAEDMSIRVAYDITGTALAVWLNCDYEDSAVFSVVVSDNIQYGDSYCVFLCSDGKYRITLGPETVVIDPYYGEISPKNILPGQELFLWVEMITASSPSIVYPDKVVLIND